MCGGKGTRLQSSTEKPLVPVADRQLIQHVTTALDGSTCEQVYAVTSPHTPATTRTVEVPVIQTPGAGYVADLQSAITDDRISLPILTVGADLPLLTPEIIDNVLQQYTGTSLTVCVPTALKRGLGVSIETTITKNGHSIVPTGVNIVHGPESTEYVSHNPRLAVNVNRPTDLQIAEAFV